MFHGHVFQFVPFAWYLLINSVDGKSVDGAMVNVLKFQTLFSFGSKIKCWSSGMEFTKCLLE